MCIGYKCFEYPVFGNSQPRSKTLSKLPSCLILLALLKHPFQIQDTSGFIRPKTFRKKQRESDLHPRHPMFIEGQVGDQNRMKNTPRCKFMRFMLGSKKKPADPSHVVNVRDIPVGFPSFSRKTMYVFHLMHIHVPVHIYI